MRRKTQIQTKINHLKIQLQITNKKSQIVTPFNTIIQNQIPIQQKIIKNQMKQRIPLLILIHTAKNKNIAKKQIRHK